MYFVALRRLQSQRNGRVCWGMPDYRKLRVYGLAEALSAEVHTLMARFPSRRAPGLVAQVCSSVQSVPANIAEGAGRESVAAYVGFLSVARGSAQETSVHLRLASRLDDAQSTSLVRCFNRADVIAAMLTNLIARIREDEARLESQRREKSQTVRRRDEQRHKG